MTLLPSNKHITRAFKYHLGLIAAIPLVMLHSANADIINWSNEATDNVGWHTASNWSGGVLPGTNTTDNVIFAANDTPYVTQPGMSINNFIDITIREEAVLTILQDLPNIRDIDLGSGLGGGHILHSSGLLELDNLNVGTSSTASSASSYVIESNGQLIISGDLKVGTGEFTAAGGTVDVGGDIDLSGGGDLKFAFDESGIESMITENEFTVHGSNSVLTVDLSFYIGGSETFKLVEFGSFSNRFPKVVFEGLKSNQSARISYSTNSMRVDITTDTVTSSANNLLFSMGPLAGTDDGVENDLILNNGSHISMLGVTNGKDLFGSGDLQSTRSTDGNDLVYSMIWSGNDYDGNGTKDTLSFDLRVKAYSGAAYTYSTTAGESSVTSLGGAAIVTEDNGRWGVESNLDLEEEEGLDVDIDEGESLEFIIENINVSVSGFDVELFGFTSFGLNETGGNSHTHIRGEGVGSGYDSASVNFPTDYDFSALTPLVITSAGSSLNGFQIDYLDFGIKVTDPNGALAEDLSDYSASPDGVRFVDPYPAQTGNVDFPEFSWDRVSRWVPVRNSSVYTQEQIDILANNYALVMMEKSNANGLDGTEIGMRSIAASLKASNPDVKTIAYWNTSLLYQDFESTDLFEDDNWSEKEIDANGGISNRLQADRLIRINREIEEARDWWVESALNLASDSNIDGIFADNANLSNPYAYNSFGEPTEPNADMYDRVREELAANKMLVGNCLTNENINGGRAALEIMDGAYLEGWTSPSRDSLFGQTGGDATVTSIQMIREALSLGKMITIRTIPGGPGIEDDPILPGSDNFAEREAHCQKWVDFPLAAYLVMAEENCFMAYATGVNADEAPFNDDVWDTSFVEQFNRTIGPPLSDPVRDGYVYTRAYTNLDVWLNVDTTDANVLWKNDIGSPARRGRVASNTDGIYNMRAGGLDIWDTSDQCYFLSDPHVGNGNFIARVDSLQQTHSSAKAGVMCRESLDADAANVMVTVFPNNEVTMQYRTATGEVTQNTGSVGDTASVKWVRLLRTGNIFTGYYSTDGTSWTTIGTQRVLMDEGVEVGLAATSHSSSDLTSAVFSNILFDK